MSPAEILARLTAFGVAVVAEEGKLRLSAARGQINEELKAAIAARKDELIALVGARAPELRPVPRDGALPLSAFQERMWVLQRLEPDSTDYNIVTAWRSDGAVETEVVAGAVRSLIACHEILRSVFVDDGGSPAVHVVPPDRVPVEVVDLSALGPDAQNRILRETIDVATHVPFDLTVAPPTRFTICRLDGNCAVVLIAAHHIAVDAWSLGLLRRELALRAAGDAVSPPVLQYVDYAAWQRAVEASPAAVAEVGWWKHRLAGAPPLSTFPTDRLRSDRATGATFDWRMGGDIAAGLKRVARAEGATTYMTMVAAFAAVLRWHSGQDDLLLASPMGVRERPELEQVIGPFVNALALRFELPGDPTFAELVSCTRTAVLDAHEHRGVPFEKLVDALRLTRSPDHPPLMQVAVVQHNAPVASSEPLFGGGAIYDVSLFFREVDGALQCSFEYRSDLYLKATIAAIAGRVEAVLAAAVADPQTRLSALPMLTMAERRLVLEDFNATARDVAFAPFAAQLARQAARTPDATALCFEGASLTYRGLDQRANQFARHLCNIGIGKGMIVGICLPRTLDLVVALVGIQRSGAAYLPLDPDYPANRLTFMLADSGAAAVVTGPTQPVGLELPPGTATIDIATARDTIGALPDGDVESGVEPADLAYVIYTSGSTGKPKGVRVRHGELVNFLASMRDEPLLHPTDVLAAVTTLSFDIAALELYLPLVVGATFVLIGKSVATNGSSLAAALRDTGATVMQATPSTWRLLVEAGWEGAPGFRALCGGEPLPRQLGEEILRRTGELWNLYGPTETTVWSTLGRVEAGSGPVTVGRPILNTQIYVLDRGGGPLPPGVAGEIWIAGAGVSEGYHGRPDLTAERFLPDRFRVGGRMYRTGDLGRWDVHGRLEHLGRVDDQVKVRGIRIELGEVETELATHPAVRQAVVLAREAGPGDLRLVAYVVYQPGGDATVSELRRFLRRQLPDHMIPSIFATLDTMPLSVNGKVDRAALPNPFATSVRGRGDPVPPAPGLEQLVAEIWRDALKIAAIGADDNFFELGGHSLLSLRVASAIEKRIGRRLDPRSLFFQTLRQIAASLVEAR